MCVCVGRRGGGRGARDVVVGLYRFRQKHPLPLPLPSPFPHRAQPALHAKVVGFVGAVPHVPGGGGLCVCVGGGMELGWPRDVRKSGHVRVPFLPLKKYAPQPVPPVPTILFHTVSALDCVSRRGREGGRAHTRGHPTWRALLPCPPSLSHLHRRRRHQHQQDAGQEGARHEGG